ncbi:MAG: prolipoprotein diacylglyceryl transferase [Dehalococcoidales bacterium]|nr:prolipoprotein diacylglyceryl transferase [Dehalococcoidales bacterium]
MWTGIIINIDPVMLRIGYFELRWYSFAIILGVIAAMFVAARDARKAGLPSEEIYYLLPWALAAGLLGARLFHVIDYWVYYMRYPLQIMAIQQGGLAIWGAMAGGIIAVIIYARVRRIPVLRLFDVLVPALLVAQIIGRAGCIINGDSPGSMTDLPWAFIYLNLDAVVPEGLYGVPTHPYPVYEMLWNGLVLGFLLAIRRRFKTDGMMFLSYLILYSVGRFGLSFVRIEDIVFLGLRQAQVIAVITVLVAVALFAFLGAKANKAAELAEIAATDEAGESQEPGDKQDA